MKKSRILELLEYERQCILRNSDNSCNRDCANCDLVQDSKELLTMYDQVMAMVKAQEPRLMPVSEVVASVNGTVLWVEERQGVTWNLFPLEIYTISTHPDTGTHYLFFITYESLKKFECDEYNKTWRCWTSRPTDAQKDTEPWMERSEANDA